MLDTALQLATAILTIVAMELVARKDRRGWMIGLANQALWFVVIVRSETWPLLFLMCWLVQTYVRAIFRWRRDDRLAGQVRTTPIECVCRSYFERTGQHSDTCPLGVDPSAEPLPVEAIRWRDPEPDPGWIRPSDAESVRVKSVTPLRRRQKPATRPK